MSECRKELGVSKEVFDKIYSMARAEAIEDVLNLDRYKFGVTMLSAEEYIKISDIKQLKEQKR